MMYKKIFAACFLLTCCLMFIIIQKKFYEDKINIWESENKESSLESVFPYKDKVREIYGYSNRIISPNEKASSLRTTIKDSDGFLQQLNTVSYDVVDFAKNKIVELNYVCWETETEFSFISYPSKISAQTVPTKYGVDTNYEEIRVDFLSYLRENEIDYLDVRELFEDDGYTTKDIFYKTDHHWKTTAGFYTARAIANHLNDAYEFSLDTSALDEDKFSFTTYSNLWFGESGRGLSRSWVNTLDDFVQIMPNYETSISQVYPDGSENTGDFSILVDESGYNGDIDYYSYSAHYSYAKGMGTPMMKYRNNKADDNGKKMLIIMDSFSVVVIPFLTLETSEITLWDMRNDATKEGLFDFIRQNDFDVVLLAYTDFWREDMWNFN